MLKIIGIPTEDEAIKLYNDWKQERDDWDKEAKRHDSILLWSVTIACILLIVGFLLWSRSWTFDALYPGFMRAGFVLVILIIGSFIVAINLDGQWEYDDFSWPMKYKYYKITNGKTILESKLENRTIYFTLENADHEVTTDVLTGFNEKYRTDVNEIIVDLEKEEILIPYQKREIV